MKPGVLWPMGITAILCSTIAANLFVMRLANDDPAFAVEPDYYRKAVQYDSTMAQERRNLALGWQVTADFEPITPDGPTGVRVDIHDAAGHPVTSATVAVMARFNARANDTLTTGLVERVPGEYAADLPIRTPGEWEVRIDVVRDDARFSARRRITATRQAMALRAPR